MRRGPCVVQVVGYKNAGKTTLLCRLVELLAARGYEVGTVKHDAHRFQMDVEGKDTWRHREAGARVVAISSEAEGRTCYLEERYTPLAEMLERMQDMDVVLVEGFKAEGYPKLAIIRIMEQLELLDRLDALLAVASWLPAGEIREAADLQVPVLDKDDAQGLEALILELMRQ
ncbi:MAG: molybdopterin-guanine dinucleotide biosynthesis protein B-like protein [Paenibacillaceae bacterium]|nr:molybdopterin-guanine dinucleotide biosynthesis protein B-like protein [Paenibacillaceae bacterium]